MKILKIVEDINKNNSTLIKFGYPENEREKTEMFKIRYDEYLARGYIEQNESGLDIDQFDLLNKCIYFIVTINEKIVGTIRIIQSDILPTQEAFEFKEPKDMLNIPKSNRCELSRFIILNYGPNQTHGLIRIVLFKVLVEFGLKHNIQGGYLFLTEKLNDKLKRSNIPLKNISFYKNIYPKSGILFKYFNQENQSIIPKYFFIKDIAKSLRKLPYNTLGLEKDYIKISLFQKNIIKILHKLKII